VSEAGLQGMRAAGGDLLAVSQALTSAQWDEESAASGWSVKDVVIHIGTALEFVQAVVAGAESPPLGTEELNEIVVAEHRDWTAATTLTFFREQFTSSLETFAGLQVEPVASTLTPILDLGTYPLHAITDMFTFDMVTHLRYDILKPRGPIPDPLPEIDEVRLEPTMAWLLSGLTQMQPALAGHVGAPILLQLTGPGGREVLVDAQAGVLTVDASEAAAARATATITSTTRDFVAWSTKRAAWQGLAHIGGDVGVATDFLDTVNLI
jgi:uncharacterized protein (TIGR03083 family)